MHRVLRAIVTFGAVLVVLARPGPAHTAPMGIGDGITGTWQVTRSCVSGCVGSTVKMEVVRPFPYQGNVHTATGGATLALYTIGKRKVLVHGAASSTILTIVRLGHRMRGPGIDGHGNTFVSIWRCVSPPAHFEARNAPQNVAARTLDPVPRVEC